MILISDETIHYIISTHYSYQLCDGLAMWRQRAFKPRKRKRCSLYPHSHTSYLHECDKSKMKLQYDKILWNVFGWLFLHKYCTYAQTSAKVFLRLIGKHFGNPSHKLRKICNRSNLKISYSWMPNMKSIISNHNKRISEKNVATKKNHAIAATRPNVQ